MVCILLVVIVACVMKRGKSKAAGGERVRESHYGVAGFLAFPNGQCASLLELGFVVESEP